MWVIGTKFLMFVFFFFLVFFGGGGQALFPPPPPPPTHTHTHTHSLIGKPVQTTGDSLGGNFLARMKSRVNIFNNIHERI